MGGFGRSTQAVRSPAVQAHAGGGPGAQDSPTHVRAGPHRPSHLHGLGDPSAGEPGRAPVTGVYAHRFTFKYIYSAWTTFPLIVKTQRNAEGSTSDKWMGNILQMRKEAVPFLESLGIPKPRSKEEWSYFLKEMGTFLAAKNFIVNCPLPVMEIPVTPIHDSAGRFHPGFRPAPGWVQRSFQ